MNLLNALHTLLGQHPQQQQQQQHPQAQQGHQLQVNPQAPNQGVIMQPHLGVGNAPQRQGGMPNLGVGMGTMQGNMQNPGFTPLQSGGQARPGSNPYAVGMQPALMPNWQNFGRPQNMVNPQLEDNGYFYDN